MKKIIVVLLVICNVIFAFGCKKEEPKQSDEAYAMVYVDSFDELFEALVNAKTGEYDESEAFLYEVNEVSEIDEILVPDFNFEGFTLRKIGICSTVCTYHYINSNQTPNLPEAIRICVSGSEDSFQAYANNWADPPVDGKKYNENGDVLYLDYQGHMIMIDFYFDYSAKDLEITDELLSFTRYNVTETGVIETNE